jgi:hypothetical protein
MRNILLLTLLLLASGACCGQNLGEITEDLSLELQLPAVAVSDDMEVEVHIVYGERIDLLERALFDYITTGSAIRPTAGRSSDGTPIEVTVVKKTFSESETSIQRLRDEADIVILIGAAEHNSLVKEAYESEAVKNETVKLAGQVTTGEGALDEDTQLIVFQHKTPEEKLEREAVKYSPLRGIVADEYIPALAATIGIFLMGLLPVLQSIVESKIADKKKATEKISEETKRVFGIKPREAAEVVAAALVLGFALTWTFAGPSTGFFDLLLLNSGVCLLAALSHDLTHRLAGRLIGIRMEYKLWYTGSFLTILTAFLGNSFGLQGFIIEKVEEGTKEWKIGLTKLAAPMVSLGITAAFVYLYSKNPDVVFQMIYSSASIIALAEITPVKGSDGEDIRRWNKHVFSAAFLIVSLTYTLVNFVL